MMRIIADDFGLAPCVNKGIVHLLQSERIDGAALMPNGSAYIDALDRIRSVALPVDLFGVHMVLVEEKSLSGVVLPRSYRTFLLWYILGWMPLSIIERELRAQLDRLKKDGLQPRFANSHQHLHLLPGIIDMVIMLAREYDISYIRTVCEPIRWRSMRIMRIAQLLVLRWLSRRARKKIIAAGLHSNNVFVGMLDAGNMTQATVQTAINLAQRDTDMIVELGCHPGFEDDALRENYRHWGGYQWQQEFEVLTS